MDPSQDCSGPTEQSTPNSDTLQNQPIVLTDVSGEVRIQLEGSHTSASETECENSKESKNVKFDGEFIVEEHQSSPASSQTMRCEEAADSRSINATITSLRQNLVGTEHMKLQPQQHSGMELRPTEKANEDIAERLKQIMDMFDAFTRNLETLELPPPIVVSMCPTVELRSEANKHRFPPALPHADEENDIPESNVPRLERQRSVSTTISDLELPAQTIEGQQAFQENFSIGQSSMITISECTSRSELQHSLNNYADAQNALPHHHSHADGHPLKQLMADASAAPNPLDTEATAVEEPCRQPYHTILIDATSSPSSTDMNRPPLCQRLWDVLTDFGAAICLCLQVNRDCIFCLGFFAAFVVSASFLTAFFYRTLSVSAPLLQPPTLLLMQEEHGSRESFDVGDSLSKITSVLQ